MRIHTAGTRGVQGEEDSHDMIGMTRKRKAKDISGAANKHDGPPDAPAALHHSSDPDDSSDDSSSDSSSSSSSHGKKKKHSKKSKKDSKKKDKKRKKKQEREKRQEKARREEEKTKEKSAKAKAAKAAALQLKLEGVYTSLQKCCAHHAIVHLPPSLVAPAQKHMATFKAAIEACAFVKHSPDGHELPNSEALPWKDAKNSEKFILSMLVRVDQHTRA